MKRIVMILAMLLILSVLTTTVFAQSEGLQAAVEAAQAGDTVTLQEDAGAIIVDKNLTLDLNGFDVASITAADGVTVLVKDSKTDDYTVADEDYGTVAAASDGVKAAEGYFAVTGAGTSYHKALPESS